MIAAATIRCEDRAANVLVAKEDDVARAFLADNLTADGYAVRTADSREQAFARLSVQQPDVIVVDVNGKTLGLIDAIRIGVIVQTTRVDELHRIRLLDRGGDDVLAKPYSYPELRARLAALLARARACHAPRLLRGELKIDLAARTVEIRGNRVEMPAKEYELPRTLTREPTRVFTREELLRDVCGHTHGGRTSTLDSHACRLRRRLADGVLQTIRGSAIAWPSQSTSQVPAVRTLKVQWPRPPNGGCPWYCPVGPGRKGRAATQYGEVQRLHTNSWHGSRSSCLTNSANPAFFA